MTVCCSSPLGILFSGGLTLSTRSTDRRGVDYEGEGGEKSKGRRRWDSSSRSHIEEGPLRMTEEESR